MDRRTFLFAGDAKTAATSWSGSATHDRAGVTVFRSRDESADVDGWAAASCYVEQAREELPVRGLVAIRLRLQC